MIKNCFPQYAITVDGSPYFAEAECVVMRMVHRKSFKIVELIVRLELFSESLDGATIAKHLHDLLVKSLKVKLRNWRATGMDRAGTNKKAMELITEKTGINTLNVYCISHGTSGSGKKSDMTVGRDLLKHATSMVKHQLSKSRNLFRSVFGENASKAGGVRWGIEYEMAAQVNRIGVQQMADKYVKPCAQNKWSQKSAEKFLKSVAAPEDLCMAMVEIAAVVDVGKHLIQETYINESSQPMVFTAWESIEYLNDQFARGVDFFDEFNEMDEKAVLAAAIMEDVVVS